MIKVFYTAMRSYLLDLLPLLRARTYSEVVIVLCRLLGCATAVGVATVSITHAGLIPASRLLPFGLLVLTVAVLVGNLTKETAILIAGVVINWQNLDFRRTRLLLNGATMSEVYRPDGTWDRYVRESSAVIHEWLDAKGECYREISASAVAGALVRSRQ